MSKKQKKLETEIQDKSSEKQNQISEGVVENKSTAKSKEKVKTKDDKKKNKGNKKEKKNGGLVKKAKETASELKKVTWPTFADVVKKTSVVVVFVILFGLFIYGLNFLLGGLSNLLTNGTFF